MNNAGVNMEQMLILNALEYIYSVYLAYKETIVEYFTQYLH